MANVASIRQARVSSESPMLNAFCRVVPSVRLSFLAIFRVGVFLRAIIFAAIVWFGLATPVNLLLFTFFPGVAGALVSPAWQAIVPPAVVHQIEQITYLHSLSEKFDCHSV
jgi:transmembrane secretion effector